MYLSPFMFLPVSGTSENWWISFLDFWYANPGGELYNNRVDFAYVLVDLPVHTYDIGEDNKMIRNSRQRVFAEKPSHKLRMKY